MFANNEASSQRYEICKKCDKFNGLTFSCSICHCFLPAKTRLAGSECPIGKWTKIDKEESHKMKIYYTILSINEETSSALVKYRSDLVQDELTLNVTIHDATSNKEMVLNHIQRSAPLGWFRNKWNIQNGIKPALNELELNREFAFSTEIQPLPTPQVAPKTKEDIEKLLQDLK